MMSENNRFSWIDFYTEFANKLSLYIDNRPSLITKIKAVFERAGLNLPKLEKGGNVYDIDPFTVFGLFNKGITTENRLKIISGFSEEFGVSAPIPTNFDGIPVLNNQKATFYGFEGDRGEKDLDNLWDVFTSAIQFADKRTSTSKEKLIKCYDAALHQLGVRWNITMGLFWIRPYAFINLDSRNRWFITNPDFVEQSFLDIEPSFNSVPTGAVYLDFCAAASDLISRGNYPFRSFPEMSAYAWTSAKEDDEKEKDAENREKAFRKWMGTQKSASGQLYSATSITHNALALRKVCTEVSLSDFPDIKNLFDVTDIELFEKVREAIMAHPDYDAVNRKHGNGYLNSALTIWYDKFLHWLSDGGDPDSLAEQTSVNALSDDTSTEVHYWLYSPGDGAAIWDECYSAGIMAIAWDEIGDLSLFASKDEMKSAMKEQIDPEKSFKMAAHATWQFVHDIKPGDIIIAKKGMYTVIGRGVVESDYERDDSRNHYRNIRQVNWTHKGEWEHPGQAAMKTLTDITPYTDYVAKLNSLFTDEEQEEVEELPEITYPLYSAEDFLSEVYMSKADYDILVAVLMNKKNVILQGAPGVGKTFAAKRLAYSIMGEKDKERVMMVQFHQSYSYEDFIMGFRPSGTGFELKKGAFYNFCKKAEEDSDNDYFFIIDEINRGNLSKIFGELFMLIETDKRGIELQLLYSDERFSVPENVYIIGMMNTADRSLAMLDYALRRRFSFIELKPGFETDGFRKYRMNIGNEKFDRLIACIESLNTVIAADDSLGEGFCIGHSYFCNLTAETATEQTLSAIVEFEIIPLLKEYWFDEPIKVRDWSNNLRSAIK